MHEALMEIWLDSAITRGYQPGFVQMLVGEGHRILHSTGLGVPRDGKDVISVAPDGVPCAYYLSGHPGSCLNLTQFHDILEELEALVTRAIQDDGLPTCRHRSYLVTNGMIEGEVNLQIAQMNEIWRRKGYGEEVLRVITRGELLTMASGTGAALWSLGVTGDKAVDALLAHRGDGMLPLFQVHALLADIYGLEEDATISPVELTKLVSCAAIMLSVALGNFAARQNHFAVISGWTLYFTYTVAAIERHGVSDAARADNALAAARKSILVSLVDLVSEACGREDLAGGDTWTDSEFIKARTALVESLAALYCLWLRADDTRSVILGDVENWLSDDITSGGLWGEPAMPQLLTQFWGIATLPGGSIRYDQLEAILEGLVCTQLGKGEKVPLARPSYGIEDIVQHGDVAHLQALGDPLLGDKARGHSFAALGLMHLLVRLERKDFCMRIWPEFAQLVHRSFVPRYTWQFCLVRAEEGRDEDVVVPPRADWAELQAAAEDFSTPEVPDRLRADPLMLLLFVIICPHRATSAVVRYLGSEVGDPWDMAEPRRAAFVG